MSESPVYGGVLRRTKQKYEKNFSITPNSYPRDESLSFKARGLLWLILSYEDGFEISIRALVRQSLKDGKDSVSSALKELIGHGYLEREKVRTGAGHFIWEYRLLEPESVIAALKPLEETPGQTRTGFPRPENPPREETPGQTRTGFPRPENPRPGNPRPGNPDAIEVTPTEVTTTGVSEVTTDANTIEQPSDICPVTSQGHPWPVPHRWTSYGTCADCGVAA